jgi:TadE-like protein
MSHLIRNWRHGRHILRPERGQAVVEFALILPVLLLVLFGIVKMGIAATSWSNETHLANEAARFAAVNSCSACGGQPIETWIITQGDTGDLKTNGSATITFTDAGAKNHCQGDPVQVKVSYTYNLLNLPILPKFSIPITATSTQRLETDWKGDGAGNKAASDTYNAGTSASHDTC